MKKENKPQHLLPSDAAAIDHEKKIVHDTNMPPAKPEDRPTDVQEQLWRMWFPQFRKN